MLLTSNLLYLYFLFQSCSICYYTSKIYEKKEIQGWRKTISPNSSGICDIICSHRGYLHYQVSQNTFVSAALLFCINLILKISLWKRCFTHISLSYLNLGLVPCLREEEDPVRMLKCCTYFTAIISG